MERRRDDHPKIIINARGDTRDLDSSSFPDKKRQRIDPNLVERTLYAARKARESFEVGQTEATWVPRLDKYGKDMLFLFLTDIHYGSTNADFEKLNYYLETVKRTPNMFLVTGGDDVDNFNVTLGRVATGIYENPINAGHQALAWVEKIKELDKKEKVGFMVFGNHQDWTSSSGIDWYDTYLGNINAPILTSGGLVRVHFREGASYNIAATHKYWGVSKLNPTNACKRYLEHEYPEADIVLLGHTHQSEMLQFDRSGQDRLAVIGGTLKSQDSYARKHGIGGRGGTPGMCISLNPNEKEIQGYRSFDYAVSEHLRKI